MSIIWHLRYVHTLFVMHFQTAVIKMIVSAYEYLLCQRN
jgi:hypothetical protein